MLPKKHRLTYQQFLQNNNKYTSFFSRHFTVLIKKSVFNLPRFTVTVSKNIDKRSSARNRMKRLVSETIREFLPKLINKNIDAMIKVRLNFKKEEHVTAKNEIINCLQKLINYEKNSSKSHQVLSKIS